MRYKYLESVLWIVKIRYKSSPIYFAWGLFNAIYLGLKPIGQTYAVANVLSSVSSAALQGATATPVYFWLGTVLGIEVSRIIVSIINRFMWLKYDIRLELDLNEQFLGKIYRLNQLQFDNQDFNVKLDRAKDAIYKVKNTIEDIQTNISSGIAFFGSIVAITIASPLVGIVIIISLVPIIFSNIKTNKLRELAYIEKSPSDRIAGRTKFLLLDPVNMPEIRLMNGFKKLLAAWKKSSMKSHKISFERDRSLLKYVILNSIFQPMIYFVANIYFFKLLLAGSLGLDRFIFLRGMLEQTVYGAMILSDSVKNLHQNSMELANFMEIFNTEPAIPSGKEQPSQPLNIEFRNVSFEYPGTGQLVLEDVSFTMGPGSKFALVGENGAGKSTLIKLLLRQYLPSSGNILINGIDIKDIDPVYYQTCISNLSQDFLLIDHLTIRENLLIGLSTPISDRAIYNATDLVGATGFIKKLPNQLNHRLDNSFDDGSNLSGGQRQRIAIARALLSNGYLMILDEPTSAVDAKAEYNILNNIYKSHEGKTTLIVSHRFSSVRKADTIVVLEQGKIKELGTHEELIKKGGLYKEMFETQAEGYK